MTGDPTPDRRPLLHPAPGPSTPRSAIHSGGAEHGTSHARYGGGPAGSLLDDIWVNALDPGYAAAAAHERERLEREGTGTDAPGAPSIRLRRAVRSASVLALVGIAAVVGVGQVRRTLSTSAGTKSALLNEVRKAESADAALTSQENTLRKSVTAERSQVLATTTAGSTAQTRLDALEAATEETAVAGPGVQVRIANAVPRTGETLADDQFVQDRDLQSLVNALWSAGAEAISVDGQRLGPESAIRTAGEAILVNFQPVSSPYLVDAVGNSDSLQTGLLNSAEGQQLQTLSSVYGIEFSVHGERKLSLAAVDVDAADLAQALPAPGGTP